MSERHGAHYNQYSGYYRPVERLSVPWVASPELDKPRGLPPLEYQYRKNPSQNTPRPAKIILADEPISSPTQDQPKRKRRGVADWLRRLADKINGDDILHSLGSEITIVNHTNARPVVNEMALESDEPEVEVPLRDWKAWGYYAYPKLHRGGGYVKNHQRWIQGLQHPALPQRPERWKEHPKGAPLPFPWQCQLNPLLRHFMFDKPPLDWDIHHYPSSRCYLGRTGNSIIPISAPDKAQPATYPFVTHMYIHSLADDSYPEHFWPFYVINEHGVTVGDVLETIWQNFQQHISRSEFDSWANLISRQQTASFAVQMRGLRAEARRIDILGTQCLFKGLEPHPNREGWSMFLGLG
ncbi:hypothetical protein C0995_009471 [Termitomyces sp. Mi166|nr:hypothetical protein C0995_009471 [Termitomyces sp. Mi166\